MVVASDMWSLSPYQPRATQAMQLWVTYIIQYKRIVQVEVKGGIIYYDEY